jgi:hypothetical protein
MAWNGVSQSYDDYLRSDNVMLQAVSYLSSPTRSPTTPIPTRSPSPRCLRLVGIARPLDEGGLGLTTAWPGHPDYWIKILKKNATKSGHGRPVHVLTNRRQGEKHVAYAESHDQALVGDNTIAFRLMDADMYWLMSKGCPGNMIIERVSPCTR